MTDITTTHGVRVQALEDITPKPSYYDECTELQKAFIDEYCTDPTNASEACRRSNPKVLSSDGARARASQLLAIPKVAAAIAERMAARIDRTKVTHDRVTSELAIIGFSNILHYTIDDFGSVELAPGVPEYMMRAVQKIKRRTTTMIYKDGTEQITREVELALWPKVTALEALGRHLPGFFQNSKVDVKLSGEVTVRQKWSFGGREIVF